MIHLEGLFEEFTVLPFEQSAAKMAGQIRADLTTAGTPIGGNDLLIGAVAVVNSLTLVTRIEFKLIFEDEWKCKINEIFP